MELNKEQYTKEEVQALLNDYNQRVAELTANLTQAQEQIKTLDELKKQNLENSIKLEMTKSGLSDDLFDLVFDEDVEKAKSKIQKLAEISKKQEINKGYIPQEHKPNNDAYAEAQKNKDVEGMISAKLSGLFQ
ncbi:MAG TPA: hypothetical protein GXX41_01980 [Thermoanaerobacterium sp.]|nr:hypothetical protein [Thermoanaerobacterium sp.]